MLHILGPARATMAGATLPSSALLVVGALAGPARTVLWLAALVVDAVIFYIASAAVVAILAMILKSVLARRRERP